MANFFLLSGLHKQVSLFFYLINLINKVCTCLYYQAGQGHNSLMLQLTSSGETMMSPTVLLKRTIYFLASNCTKYYQVTSVLLCPVFFLATCNRKPQIQHFRVVKALSVEHTSTVLYAKFR